MPFVDDERGRIAVRQLQRVFVRKGSGYVARRITVERGDLLDTPSRGHVMPRERSLDIHEEVDLAFAQLLSECRGTR